MDLMKEFKSKARKIKKRIILPEGYEPRVIKAAAKIFLEATAEIILLGKKNEIKKIAEAEGVNIEGINIINPLESDLLNEFTDTYFDLRKHKGISIESAREQVKDPLYFGTLMVQNNYADGMVAGSINSTANVLKPAFQIIKTSPGISVVSGAMIVNVPESEYGEKGLFIFSDCAVNPCPDENQLAEIAISSAETAKSLLGIEPFVALLSFSTKGSASHELVEKVQKASIIAREKAANIMLDGELQADAAIVPTVAKLKAPGSKVAGKANVLVFPDLQSGNISYKLVQRLAKADAVGPVLQGMAKPVNDLSRGCSVEDIVNLVAITALQSNK
jgi:phosphate acetyltransferase